LPVYKPEKSVLRQVFEASTVGIHLVLCIFAGLAIGYGLDTLSGKFLFKTFPVMTIIFFIMGIIAGFREVMRIAKKAERMQNEDNDRDNDKKDK
jgi:ATP synthase protein I